MILIPALLADATALSTLRARQRFDLYNLRRLATPAVTFVGFAIAQLALRGGLSALIDAYVIVTVMLACLGLVLTCREVPLRPKWSWRLTREALSFGLKSYLQNMVGTLNYRLDVYLLAYLLTPEQVAFYGVATSLAEVAWHIPNSVGTVLFPRLSHAPLDQVHQVTAKVCRNTLALAGCTVLGLLSAGWILVPTLYGPAYQATIPPLVILLPGVLSMSLYKVLTRNYSSRGRQQMSILASGLALVVNVGLNWWLIPLWGVIGAATASTTGYTLAGTVLLILFLRDSGLSWQEALLPRWHELIGHLGWAKENLGKWKGRHGEL
jgi:O-antigen/teichoic acid export membrane protein